MNDTRGNQSPTGKQQKLIEEILGIGSGSNQVKVACKPCNPSAGLAIGGKPITMEELNLLTPDDLEENAVTRNGVELTMAEFAELLDMPPEFAELLDQMEDDALVDMEEACIAANDTGALLQQQQQQEQNEEGAGGGAFLPPNADEFLFLAFAEQFRGPSIPQNHIEKYVAE